MSVDWGGLGLESPESRLKGGCSLKGLPHKRLLVSHMTLVVRRWAQGRGNPGPRNWTD
jgi:hypothetical protein